MNPDDGHKSTSFSFSVRTSSFHSSLQDAMSRRNLLSNIALRNHENSASSFSTTKKEDRIPRIDSKDALGDKKLSIMVIRCITLVKCGHDVPLKAQRIATDMRTITSLPSKKYTSHKRSCVRNDTVLANRVIYHLTAYAVVEIMFCFCLKDSAYMLTSAST
jgi:hypothetical protein